MISLDGQRFARNLAAGGAASLLRGLIQIIMLPVMGRLLGPAEFGLYATVLPIAAFFFVIADGGLATSLARDKTDDPVVWSTAFYIVVAISLCITVFTLLCGLALSHYVGNPQLCNLSAVLASSFPLIALSAMPTARLIRQNDLVSLSLIDVIALLVGAALAVLLALRGFGAFSLAFQTVATAAVRAFGLNLLAFVPPKKHFRLAALTDHISIGGALLGTRLVDMFCRFGENVLFASAFGTVILGSYTFANQVSRFLCESVSNPVWSATYAHSLRLRNGEYIGLILKMTQMMCAVTFPLAALLIAASPDIVPLLLGEKWRGAVPFIQILIPSYAIMVSASICGAVFLTSGKTQGYAWTSVLMSLGRIVAVGAGPLLGATGVVWAVAFVQIACAALMVGAAVVWYSITSAQLAWMVRAPLALGLVGGSTYVGLLHYLPRTSEGIALSLGAGGLAIAAGSAVARHELAFLGKRDLLLGRRPLQRSAQGSTAAMTIDDGALPRGSSRILQEIVKR